MFKKFLFILACPLFLSACSDEPNPDVFMQIAEITNEDGSISKQFSYDSYGRITAFRSTYPTETVNVEYEYVSDNLIKITTEDIVFDYNGAQEFARTYRDELHLEKGQAVFCEGIFSQTQQGIASFEKKYRREFGYTTGNRLNTIKCTEWNRSGDKWDEDSPWTWENYYHWENDNLVKSRTVWATHIRLQSTPSDITVYTVLRTSSPFPWTFLSFTRCSSKAFSAPPRPT